SPPSSHATPARRMSSCNARRPCAPSSCTRSAPSQASGLRPSASEPGRTPMQESRDRASSDGRAPLVASLLESARTKGRKMLCASPDHQLVHVQAAVSGPQNRQYQTSGTTCRIRVHVTPLASPYSPYANVPAPASPAYTPGTTLPQNLCRWIPQFTVIFSEPIQSISVSLPFSRSEP